MDPVDPCFNPHISRSLHSNCICILKPPNTCEVVKQPIESKGIFYFGLYAFDSAPTFMI